MPEKIKLTLAEKEALETRKEHIQNVDKPEVEAELTLARSQGDLSENADYDAALEKNQMLQNELNTIAYQLDNCIVPERDPNDPSVQFGDTVTFRSSLGKVMEYTIGGLTDLTQKKIDYKSLVAVALLGKNVNDTVLINAARPYKATILKIVHNA